MMELTTIHNGHSQLIKSAVHSITTNQDNVSKGFQNVVKDYHIKALQRKTFLRYLKYYLVFFVLGVVAIIADDYVKQVNLYVVMLILLTVFAIFVLFWAKCIRCVKARKIMNWRMCIASRYLPVCQVSQHYMELMIPTLTSEVEKVCHCQLAGSSGDSFGFFPSYSANVSVWNTLTPPPFTQDVDMNLFYDALVLSERNLIEIGQPGFCWVQLNETDIPPESFIHDCTVRLHSMPMTYLSGKLVSDKIGSFIPTGAKNIEYNYPAITYKTDIGGPQGTFEFDVDVVFGIKLNLWPSIAKDWPERAAERLPAELVDNITSKGCYIVHKHCNGVNLTPDHQDHNLDWRITFVEAESLLFNYHSSKEALKLCYVILKFVIKLYSAKIQTTFPVLKSYHLKTVFLHFAEENRLYNMDVIKTNDHLSDIFMSLLENYINALETKTLPHYFMPSVNILSQYSDEQINAGLQALKELQRKPLWVVEMFDSAWINRKKSGIIFLVLIVLKILAIIAYYIYNIYFSARSYQLDNKADKAFIDLFGEENKDLLKLDDHMKLEFLDCFKNKFEMQEKLSVADVELAVKKATSLCRELLGVIRET